jgi:hypothetical protein
VNLVEQVGLPKPYASHCKGGRNISYRRVMVRGPFIAEASHVSNYISTISLGLRWRAGAKIVRNWANSNCLRALKSSTLSSVCILQARRNIIQRASKLAAIISVIWTGHD